jgi:proteasome alpha subunit
MTEEPYRWLEAISNRREYIRDQIKGGTPVFVLSRPEGIFLLGVGAGQQAKIFEIYDRHAFGALGHPVDIEKLRQAAIEAAHMEGFHRSPDDVTLRRLISFALSTSLKNAFEQIYAPPIMVESIFAELGESQAQDVLVRLHYDGNHLYETSGVVVAFSDPKREEEAAGWIRQNLQPNSTLKQVASLCLKAWQALMEEKPFADLPAPTQPLTHIDGKTIEAALLDRKLTSRVHYRTVDLASLKN